MYYICTYVHNIKNYLSLSQFFPCAQAYTKNKRSSSIIPSFLIKVLEFLVDPYTHMFLTTIMCALDNNWQWFGLV